MYATSLPVPPQMQKLGSVSHTWEALVMNRASIHDAARWMNVSLSDAKEGLRYAASRLRARQENCEKAEEVLKASGAAKQEISRRAWDDVALGLRSSA